MAVSEAILRRVEKRAGLTGLVQALAERLKPDELTSLLLAVFERRARRLSPAQVLQRYERDAFVRPVGLDVDASDAACAASFEAAASFERLELSPLAPLATCTAVAPVDQSSIVATGRSTEVASDPTNVLALEAAVRRRALLAADARDATAIRLCATHRAVRAPRAAGVATFQHFRLFGAITAGRDTGSRRFERAALVEHVALHLRTLDALRRRGFAVPTAVKVTLQRPDDDVAWVEDVATTLRADHPDVQVEVAPRRATAYYPTVSFSLEIEDACLADGGLVPWTATLLSNAKERLFISGLGTDRAVALYAPSGQKARSSTNS